MNTRAQIAYGVDFSVFLKHSSKMKHVMDITKLTDDINFNHDTTRKVSDVSPFT